MTRNKMLGALVRQAREEKGWTRQELADKMGTNEEEIGRLEDGEEDFTMAAAAGYFFLLDISPNITIYEDDMDEALKLDRIFRELQQFKPEQVDRLCESVRHIMRWRADHPDVVTVEDYWKATETGGQ